MKVKLPKQTARSIKPLNTLDVKVRVKREVKVDGVIDTLDAVSGTLAKSEPNPLQPPKATGVSTRQTIRTQRYKQAAEALRRGDRDRFVELMNRNKADDAKMIMTMVALDFGAAIAAEVFPVASVMIGMIFGFKSCQEADISGVIGLGAGRRSAPRVRTQK